jgi:hypothetical protein
MRCLDIRNHFRNLDTGNGKKGRERGNSLLFSVFGTRTVVFQIAIPWNFLKTSSSSYHVSYSAKHFIMPGIIIFMVSPKGKGT